MMISDTALVLATVALVLWAPASVALALVCGNAIHRAEDRPADSLARPEGLVSHI